MTRILTAFALALSIASTSVVALAAPHGKAAAAKHEKGEKGERGDKKFPMKADEFKKHVAERIQKARSRMEKHVSKKDVSADKAKEIREKFDAAVARINKKVDEVAADGTVTKEEAKEVHALFAEMHKGHGDKKHGKKGDKKRLGSSAKESEGGRSPRAPP